MANQYSVNRCSFCNQWYCMECCDHKEWQEFCSAQCVEDAADEAEAEAIDEAAQEQS